MFSWFQVRDLSIAYVLVGLTYLYVGVLIFAAFPAPPLYKDCIEPVRFTFMSFSFFFFFGKIWITGSERIPSKPFPRCKEKNQTKKTKKPQTGNLWRYNYVILILSLIKVSVCLKPLCKHKRMWRGGSLSFFCWITVSQAWTNKSGPSLCIYPGYF